MLHAEGGQENETTCGGVGVEGNLIVYFYLD